MPRRDSSKAIYDPKDEPIVITKATLDRLLKTTRPAECLALYIFYYQTAKWQGTNKARATAAYCMEGLNWGRDRFYATKKELLELGLVEDVLVRAKDQKIVGHYIKVHFLKNHTADFPQGGLPSDKCFVTGIKKTTMYDSGINPECSTPKDFDEVWPHFPKGETDGGNIRQSSKAATRKAWCAACTSKAFTQCRPPKPAIAIAILQHIGKTVDPKFIAMATTITNQGRWEDYPDILGSPITGGNGVDTGWVGKQANTLCYVAQRDTGEDLDQRAIERQLADVWLAHDGAAHAGVAKDAKAFVRKWCLWAGEHLEEWMGPPVYVGPGKKLMAAFLASRDGGGK